jgi:hypothetical protein
MVNLMEVKIESQKKFFDFKNLIMVFTWFVFLSLVIDFAFLIQTLHMPSVLDLLLIVTHIFASIVALFLILRIIKKPQSKSSQEVKRIVTK